MTGTRRPWKASSPPRLLERSPHLKGRWKWISIAPFLFLACEDISADYMPLDPGRYWESRPSAGPVRLTMRRRLASGGVVAREPDGTHTWEKTGRFLVHWTRAEAALLYPLPPHTGNRWQTKSADGHVFYSELLPRETLKLPAGEFEGCLHVRMQRDDDLVLLEMWFAPGVGLVKRKVTTPAGEELWVLERHGREESNRPSRASGSNDR